MSWFEFVRDGFALIGVVFVTVCCAAFAVCCAHASSDFPDKQG